MRFQHARILFILHLGLGLVEGLKEAWRDSRTRSLGKSITAQLSIMTMIPHFLSQIVRIIFDCIPRTFALINTTFVSNMDRKFCTFDEACLLAAFMKLVGHELCKMYFFVYSISFISFFPFQPFSLSVQQQQLYLCISRWLNREGGTRATTATTTNRGPEPSSTSPSGAATTSPRNVFSPKRRSCYQSTCISLLPGEISCPIASKGCWLESVCNHDSFFQINVSVRNLRDRYANESREKAQQSLLRKCPDTLISALSKTQSPSTHNNEILHYFTEALA
jgi:hypothetical protein